VLDTAIGAYPVLLIKCLVLTLVGRAKDGSFRLLSLWFADRLALVETLKGFQIVGTAVNAILVGVRARDAIQGSAATELGAERT
jgi:hypothetical protein